METLNLLAQLEQIPEGEWVVLSSDQKRVVAHNRELQAALDEAARVGEKDTVFMRNFPLGDSYII